MISSTQREILEALVELYEKKKESIKGEDISRVLHRTAGTVRNQMQTLKAMGYVDGVPGPKGGYMPAMKAYEILDMRVVKKPYIVNIYRDDKPVDGLAVQRITFPQIQNPTECMAMVSVMGDTRQIKDHDIIKVGPTSQNHLILRGEVVGRDDSKRELMIASRSISSIPKGKVIEIATKDITSFSPDTPIKECAKILGERRIRAAPVMQGKNLVGIITEREIVRAVAAGHYERTVGEIAIKEPLTIDADAKLIDCIEKMKKYDVGRLIVMKDDSPIGIITKTDIILRMLD